MSKYTTDGTHTTYPLSEEVKTLFETGSPFDSFQELENALDAVIALRITYGLDKAVTVTVPDFFSLDSCPQKEKDMGEFFKVEIPKHLAKQAEDE